MFGYFYTNAKCRLKYKHSAIKNATRAFCGSKLEADDICEVSHPQKFDS